MIVNNNIRYERVNVIGGSGIFDTLINIAKKVGPSLLESAAKSAASEAGKHLASKILSPKTTPSTGIAVQDKLARAAERGSAAYEESFKARAPQPLQVYPPNYQVVRQAPPANLSDSATSRINDIIDKYSKDNPVRQADSSNTSGAGQNNSQDVIDIRDYVNKMRIVEGSGNKMC